MAQISLADVTHGQVRNLSGHERGLSAREMLKLEVLDAQSEPVTVLVPDDLDAISTSFFQGMFADSVRRFSSSEAFFQHYRFVAPAPILIQLQRGISAVNTRRISPLTE